jgi:hypothetical protein
MTAESIDYDGLMQANLARVFGERDASRRMKVIAELYADDAILYEPDAAATGHAAISQAENAPVEPAAKLCLHRDRSGRRPSRSWAATLAVRST